MATSSITHNFVISGDEAVQRFVDALDASEKDPEPPRSRVARELKDPQEIAELMARWRAKHAEKIRNR